MSITATQQREVAAWSAPLPPRIPEIRYERDQLGRTRPIVDHSADPLVPEAVQR